MLYYSIHLIDDPVSLFCVCAGSRASNSIINLCKFLSAARLIKLHDRHQHNGICNAMRDVVPPAQRVGQRMHGCGARTGDGNACVEGGLHHFFLRVQRVSVVAGFFQIGEDEPQRLHREQITERVGLSRSITLNSVAQCVDAGGSCDFAWQATDHLAVQNDRIRDHFGIDDADFQLFFRCADLSTDRVPCNCRPP